jgi:hypothetical protein
VLAADGIYHGKSAPTNHTLPLPLTIYQLHRPRFLPDLRFPAQAVTQLANKVELIIPFYALMIP